MSERFHLAVPPRDGRALLEGAEARHLARVLRARVGDHVTLFDGAGTRWPARVAALGRDRVDLFVEAAQVEAEAAATLTLAVALPKGDRQQWMVEKLTELGVARLVPLLTSHGVALPTAAARERLERAVIEACKQCGRDRAMVIGSPTTVADAARATAGTRLLVADPTGGPLAAVDPVPAATTVLVGPEGGFTAEETAAALAAGAERVSLGRHVLRVETAAIAAAARWA